MYPCARKWPERNAHAGRWCTRSGTVYFTDRETAQTALEIAGMGSIRGTKMDGHPEARQRGITLRFDKDANDGAGALVGEG